MADLQKAVSDTEFSEKLKVVKTPEEFLHLCQAKGIQFTRDEVSKIIAPLPDQAAALTDEELEQATGGFHIGLSIDLCQHEPSIVCARMFWGKCEHYFIEYEGQLKYVSCKKGFFKKLPYMTV